MKKLLSALAIAVAMIFAAPSAALAKKTPEKAPAKAAPAASSEKLDLNTATKAQLMALDGVGEAYSEKIVKCRTEKPLKAKDELKERCGIPDATYAKITDKVIAKQAKAMAKPKK